jgi:hypothetical protein
MRQITQKQGDVNQGCWEFVDLKGKIQYYASIRDALFCVTLLKVITILRLNMDWTLVNIGNKPRTSDRGRILSASDLAYRIHFQKDHWTRQSAPHRPVSFDCPCLLMPWDYISRFLSASETLPGAPFLIPAKGLSTVPVLEPSNIVAESL